VNVIDFNMEVQAAVDAPRLHHQWFPDKVKFEKIEEYAEVVAQLRKMGHVVERVGRQGDAHTIRVDPRTGIYYGAADRRISGKAAGY
jgi:gamma-glutamyltranspeptidase/glutathione hydrolase